MVFNLLFFLSWAFLDARDLGWLGGAEDLGGTSRTGNHNQNVPYEKKKTENKVWLLKY